MIEPRILKGSSVPTFIPPLPSITFVASSHPDSLHHPRDWFLSHVRSPALRSEFEIITRGLSDALDFSHTIGADLGRESVPFDRGGGRGVLGEVDFYTSHEGLKLDWEQAMSREVDITGSGSSPKERGFYNTSAHFLWVGDRMRQLDGAHIEYFRGIRNPIGIKVGPSLQNEELIRLLQIVNPNKESGRVTLITRYGAGTIGDHLAGHIEAVKRSQHPVAWVCDPMHGNTLTSSSGFKIRNFGTVISELTSCISIHAACGSRLGGVSLEFTGELNDEGFSVTECLGGSMELSEEQLGLRYQVCQTTFVFDCSSYPQS
ncbi:DAHP synthetase [Suillus subluteus]|nr:DAHP synthetase [Suillus subluteus]